MISSRDVGKLNIDNRYYHENPSLRRLSPEDWLLIWLFKHLYECSFLFLNLNLHQFISTNIS